MTSIEFRPVCSYASPLSSQRTRRSVQGVSASCCMVLPQRGLLFAGLSDGKILVWESIDRNGGDRRAKESKPRVLEGHKGDVRSMIFVESLCQGVMITGASDRCIKMWDLSDPRINIPCVHSLYGHGGTVIALDYGLDLLLSSSTDGFLFVWRDSSPARLLRFPSYAVRQRLETGGSSKSKETWFLSISTREGETPLAFAGDSEGYVHIFKRCDLSQVNAFDKLFELLWKVKAHELGVSKIVAVPMESFLFTLSYDQKLKAMDSVSGQTVFQETNQCNTVFNSIAWDSTSQDVIVADNKGNLGFYNLIQETWITWKNVSDESILEVHLLPSKTRLLLLMPHSLQVLEILRGVKFKELKEHSGPVVSISSRSMNEGGVLYTAAMDNTIRMWDAETLECIKCIKEKKEEITAMIYLPRANVIITGHENSDLKMWSLDCEQAYLRTVTGQSVHENTISALIVVHVHGDSSVQPENTPTGFELVVAGSYDRLMSFWRVTLTSDSTAMAKFKRVVHAHPDATDEILALGSSATTGALFSGGNEGIIRQWSLWGTVPEAELRGHEDAITCFAADGHFLYSGSADGTIRIWECTRKRQLKVLNLHEVTVQALLMLPDSGACISCAGGKVVIWQCDGDNEVTVIRSYEQPEDFRALHVRQQDLLAGCESGKIVSFPLPEEVAPAADEGPSGVKTPPSEGEGQPDNHEKNEGLAAAS